MSLRTPYTCKSFLVVLIAILLIRCTSNTTYSHRLTIEDTTKVVQSVLADSQLESELVKDFGNQQLKLMAGSAAKTDQQYTFAGKPVRVLPAIGDVYQTHKQYPKGLYASVTSVKFFPKDSATVLLIFHAGNATALFKLKNDKEKWIIKGRQYGKF